MSRPWHLLGSLVPMLCVGAVSYLHADVFGSIVVSSAIAVSYVLGCIVGIQTMSDAWRRSL